MIFWVWCVVPAIGAIAVCMRARPANEEERLTEAETHAVVQAVQDEIYDYGFEEDYDRAGENVAGTSLKWISLMPVYIAPKTENGGEK